MSTNEHLDAIRHHLNLLEPRYDIDDWYAVGRHVEALAAELETERARVARLQAALRALGALADHRSRQGSPHYPSVLSEDGRSELGLYPDDLPDEEATR